MATPRSQQLANLAETMPRRNEQAAAAGRASADLAIKQFVGQQGTPTGPGTAQQMAAQAVKAKAEPDLQAAQKGMQQQGQIAQMQLQEKQQENRSQEMKRRIGDMKRKEKHTNLLNSIDQDAKNQLIDRQMEFQQDSFGRTMYTQEQLWDFALLQARDEEELANYAQAVRQATKNEIYMLEHTNKLIQQEIENTMKMNHSKQRQERILYLRKKQKQAIRAKKRAQQRKAHKAQVMGGAVRIIGTVVGTVYGGPAGGQAGGALGEAAGTQMAGMGYGS